MIDLTKTCRSYLKTGVLGVQGVPHDKNNDITESCKYRTRDTKENQRCPTCPQTQDVNVNGTPRTQREIEGVPKSPGVFACNSYTKQEKDTGDTKDTGKKKGTTIFHDVPIEENLKPCFLCGGRDFIHGHRGGYYCVSCQPGARAGVPVRAGSTWS